MKLGQVMSFLDVGLVPEEYREEFQAKLAELRDAAPKVSFKDMKKVLEQESTSRSTRSSRPSTRCRSRPPRSARSTRRACDDGRDVAVKVQYPGVATAVRADMQNLGMILRLMKSVAPGLDPKALGAEIRSRIDEELDYELEAQNQRALARIFRDHPFIVIPDVVTRLARARDRHRVRGRARLRGDQAAAQAERDRIGEIDLPLLLRLHVPPPPVQRRPAPGQLPAARRRPHGVPGLRAVQAHPAAAAEFELQSQRLGIERRAGELIEHLHAAAGWAIPSYYTEEGILEQFDDFTWWYSRDEEIELTPEIATEVMIQMSDPRSRHFGQMRHETLPPDHLFGRRLEMLTLAVLGQLRATANWHRIAREWIYGDEPVTELGKAEAEFYARRPPVPA